MSSSSLFASLGSALHTTFSSPRSSPSSAAHHPELAAFSSHLAAQLDELITLSTAGTASLDSAPWLCRALEVVVGAHASMEAFVPDLRRALASGDTQWLDGYLDDSAKLLDICSELRESIAEMRNYNLVSIQSAVRCLNHDQLGEALLRRAKQSLDKYCRTTTTSASSCALLLKSTRGGTHANYHNLCQLQRSRLNTCKSVLRRMGEKLNTSYRDVQNNRQQAAGPFSIASYLAQMTTIFICGVLTSTLACRHPMATPMVSIVAPHHSSTWSSILTTLQLRVKEHIDSKKKAKGVVAAHFKELENVLRGACTLHTCLDKMLNTKPYQQALVAPAAHQVHQLRQYVRALEACSNDLNEGLSLLELHASELFKVLTASRMALLDIYSHSLAT